MLKKSAKYILFSILAIILLGIAVSTVINKQGNKTKIILSNELASLSQPTGCTETDRKYTTSSLTTSPSWSVTYLCGSRISGKEFYDDIAPKLSEKGYDLDSSNGYPINGTGNGYDFIYSSKEFTLSYSLGLVSDSSYVSDQQYQLEQSRVGTVNLSLVRK